MKTVLAGDTKNSLLDLIKRRGEISLDAATRELGLAKTTLRQHLLALENQQLVARKYEKSGQGRPKVLFTLAEAGQHLYPTREPELLRELLEYLQTSGQTDTVRKFFERHWAECRKRFETVLHSLPGRKTDTAARLQALRILLKRDGFMPQIERRGNGVIVRECHCPFPETIRVTTLPCKLESEFIKWALKAPMRRTQYIPTGDTACSYTGKPRP
jgi:predicted ArsR family transcriptional regulator